MMSLTVNTLPYPNRLWRLSSANSVDGCSKQVAVVGNVGFSWTACIIGMKEGKETGGFSTVLQS